MVFLGERCYKILRLMFLAMGLWPYQKSFIWRIQTVFFFSAYCSNLLFQCTAFLTTTCNIDCILKRFTYIGLAFGYVLCYCSCYCNSKTIKQALKHMQLDWKMFENSDTIKIYEEYFFLSYVFAVFACISIPALLSSWAVLDYSPVILDAIMPMNISRPRTTEVDTEFFLNKEKYFLLYVCHEIIGGTIGFCSILVLGTYCIFIARHSCATYTIASRLIQNTATVHMLQLPVTQEIQFIHRSISFSVYLHRRSHKLIKDFVQSNNVWFCPIVVMCVLGVSFLLLRMYNNILQYRNVYDLLVCFMLLYSCFMYMFLTSLLSQIYTDHSVEILKSTYDTLWYVAPVPIQKLYLFMQISIKPHMPLLGGIFAFSMEGFSTDMLQHDQKEVTPCTKKV